MNMKTLPVLRWSGPHGELVELAVHRYQFPEIAEGYDANWLIVDLVMAVNGERFERSSPCLLTWELQWFARWLSAVTDGKAEVDLDTLEGDIGFQYVAKTAAGHVLVVIAQYGLTP